MSTVGNEDLGTANGLSERLISHASALLAGKPVAKALSGVKMLLFLLMAAAGLWYASA